MIEKHLDSAHRQVVSATRSYAAGQRYLAAVDAAAALGSVAAALVAIVFEASKGAT